VTYFSHQTSDLSSQLSTYKSNILELEQHLRGVEAQTMQQLQQLMYDRSNGSETAISGGEDQLKELGAVLRGMEDSILKVASKVGGARESVQELSLGER